MKKTFLLVLTGTFWAASAWAKPVAPAAVCNVYPDAPNCAAGVPACTFCHLGTPPTRNSFGAAVEAALLPGAARPLSDADFVNGLASALAAVEADDSDGDGATNLEEIMGGTRPWDALNKPVPATACGSGTYNPGYKLCEYDHAFTYKKLHLDFCGRSPTFAEMEAFEGQADKQAALHAALDVCLDTDFWMGRDGEVWRMAHAKIRPLQAIKAGEDAGPIPLGDYYDDYGLFVYTQIDNHDVREVLTADYFVTRRYNPTRYEVAGPQDSIGDQSVTPDRRAGMMTTRWNLILNVMFTALPRTAAAQAYRSFLGMDIARLEGLSPIEGEPLDYDDKGVQAPACANCHSTLDPLSYPFKNYQGLTGRVGSYESDRISSDFRNEGPIIEQMPEAGYILGQPVNDLGEWAQVAASSDAFLSATVMDYWKLLMGQEPNSNQVAEFTELWQALGGRHQYSVEKMLHQLIETEAYGEP